MSKEQYKRVYNLTFGLVALCSAYFAICGAKYIVEEKVIASQQEGMEKMYERQRIYIHNKLIDAGKKEEAEAFWRSPEARSLGLMVTLDENGKEFGPRALSRHRRIRFLEENVVGVSVVGVLVSYALLYFTLWQIGLLSVRYVKGKPSDQSLESGKQ